MKYILALMVGCIALVSCEHRSHHKHHRHHHGGPCLIAKGLNKL